MRDRVTQCMWVGIILLIGMYAAAQERSPYFDQTAEVWLPQNYDESKQYPVVVFNPATYTMARGESRRFGVMVEEQDEYIVVLPPGRFTRNDYLPNFMQFVEWYEQRLLIDLKEVLENYAADPDRIYAAGYSLGGDMSWALTARNPDIFAGAVMAGTRTSYPILESARDTLRDRDFRAAFLIGEHEIPARANGIRRAHALLNESGVTTLFKVHPARQQHESPSRRLAGEALAFIIEKEDTDVSPWDDEPQPGGLQPVELDPSLPPDIQLPDWESDPQWGSIELVTGFAPDPYTVTITAGGNSYFEMDACGGYMQYDAPGVLLQYQPGAQPLSVLASSDADVMLLIRIPSGEWICEADTANSGDASISFVSPQEGLYRIWIGTSESVENISSNPRAELVFTQPN